MRANLEDNLARRLRHASALYNTVELTLSGTYRIGRDGAQFHFLAPGGATRDVFLPPIEPGGGQYYIITNVGTGSNNLLIRNDGGVLQYTLPSQTTIRVVSSKLRWFISADSIGGIGTINSQPGPSITISEGEGIDVTSPAANDIRISGQVFTSTLRGDVPASGGGITNFLRADGSWAVPVGGSGGREILLANRAYFVSTTGSDSNNGLTGGTPFLSIQKAVDVACALDLSIFSVQINVAAGTYPGNVILKSYLGRGPISIVGIPGAPQDVTLETPTGDVFNAPDVLGRYNIAGFTVSALAFGYANIRAFGGSTSVQFQNIRWGQALFQVMADYGAQVFLTGTQEIIGDAAAHYVFTNKGIIQDMGKTITLTGPRTFTYFAFGQNNGFLTANGNTYVGSATGQRYNNSSLSLIQTLGAGPDYFPGSIPGTSWDGGYL